MSSGPTLPARPLIPLTLPLLGILVVTLRCILLTQASDRAPMLMAAGLAVAAMSFVAWRVVLCAVPVPSSILGLVMPAFLFLALGACLGSYELRGLGSSEDELSSHPISSYVLEISSDSTKTTTGFWCQAAVVGEGGRRVGLVWVSSEWCFDRGKRLRCVGRFAANDDDAWGSSSRAQGICGTVTVSRRLSVDDATGIQGAILAARGFVVARIDPASSSRRALLAGVVCGERQQLKETGVEQTFATCGLAHLIAVSGSHLAILSNVLTSLLLKSRLRPRGRGAIVISTLCLYTVFCGAPASAIRSCAMCVAASGAQAVGRRSHATSSVCLVSIVMCCLDPPVTGQLGFLLSVLSVVGLCLFSSYSSYIVGMVTSGIPVPGSVRRLWGKIPASLGVSVSTSISSTLVAQTVTLPLTIDAFGCVPIVAPLANALVAPLFTLLVGSGFAAACLSGVPVLPCGVLGVCDAISAAMIGVCDLLADVPMASVPVTSVGLMGHVVVLACAVALLIRWPEVTRGRILLVCAGIALAGAGLLVRFRFGVAPRVVVFDIGQGDAVLVQDGSSAVLIDTGPDDAVVDALARNHVYHLDAVILTHLHADHIDGLLSLKGRVPVDRVVTATGVPEHVSDDLLATIEDETGEGPGVVAYGDVIRVGRFSLRCVWPRRGVDGKDNEDSICFALGFSDGGAALSGYLTGDAEEDQTERIVAAGDIGDVDLLKVGHHGSETSITPEEAGVLDAEVSVASAGEANSFGHPTQTCMDVIEGSGSVFLCTKDVGDVEVTPGTAGPKVRCQRLTPSWRGVT